MSRRNTIPKIFRMGKIWRALFEEFQDVDDEYFCIDATFIRANQCAAGYKKGSHENLGRSCGGLSTKINALVDALGNPVDFLLAPGNEHDIKKAEELTKGLKDTNLLGDKAFDCLEFVESLAKRGCVAVIPSRSNAKEKREIDQHLYKERHLVECFFNKIKYFRGIAIAFRLYIF